MIHKVSWDRGAEFHEVIEAVQRVFERDGVPRHVYKDGTIKKYDWELVSTDEILDSPTCVSYEEHIKRLIDEQVEREMGQD